MTNYLFSKLSVEGWRQFDDIEIELHPKLTVITGANGSGKSTLLSIFTQHFGWSRNYLSTPVRDKVGNISYATGILNRLWHKIKFSPNNPDFVKIGQVSYSNGVNSNINVHRHQSAQYGISFDTMQPVVGIHVDSYRPPPIYSMVSTIPLVPMTAEQAYNNYNGEVMSRYNGGHTGLSPIFRMKEAIISMAVFGEGNSDIGRNQSIIDTFSGFNDILRKVLPDTLGFERISVRSPEVVIVTKSGEFMLDASSGGIMTLIDIAWRIYMFSRQRQQFVVTMDEPENHLHPSMQRSLMRRLIAAFPNVQFIIATHSPFMVSSVKDSNVYVLRYQNNASSEFAVRDANIGKEEKDAHNRVNSLKLTNVNKAASTSDILREVLGVPATMPEWVEDGLENVLHDFKGREITVPLLGQLRSRLSELGYADYYPEALASLTRQ